MHFKLKEKQEERCYGIEEEKKKDPRPGLPFFLPAHPSTHFHFDGDQLKCTAEIKEEGKGGRERRGNTSKGGREKK